MKYACAIVLLGLLVGCPTESPGNNAPAPAPEPETRKESKVVILHYATVAEQESEEKRLDEIVKQGWSVVDTEAKSEPVPVANRTFVEWTIVVTLEREVPAN